GTTTDSSTPVPVTGITTASSVSAGFSHTCAVLADGTIRCWGSDLEGELGNGKTAQRLTRPTRPRGHIGEALAVSAGSGHTCTLRAGGTAECWGDDGEGELGNDSVDMSTVPIQTDGITAAVAIATGADHACALLADRTVACWGSDFAG